MKQNSSQKGRVTRYAIVTAAWVGISLSFIHAMDEWDGTLAYRRQYLIFSMAYASVVALPWLVASKKKALVVLSITFALLMSLYVVTKPSARILREVLIDMEPGTRGEEVQGIVERAYNGSGFAPPKFHQTPDSIHVLLAHHEPGHCTSGVFRLKNGLVVGCEFSGD